MSTPLPRAWLLFLAANTLSQLGNSAVWFALDRRSTRRP